MNSKTNRRDFMKISSGIGSGLVVGFASFEGLAQTEKSADDFFEVIKNRRSVRKFKNTPIPEEHLQKILDAARLAPTAGNQQPVKLVVIRDAAKIEELKKECISNSIDGIKKRKNPSEQELEQQQKKVEEYFNGLLAAPVQIVVLTDNKSTWPDYNLKDGTLAAGYLILSARALGYGSVFITDSVSEEITKKVCHIPDQYSRICFIPVGIPEAWPEYPEKKKLDELVVYNSF